MAEGDGSGAIASKRAWLPACQLRRRLLCLQADDRLALSLEADGLRLIPQDAAKTSSVRALIGCAGDQGPALALEAMDPACF